MKPAEILTAFDRYLADRNLRLEGVVIGGAALNLLGVVSRPTKDCDILLPPLPAAIVEAARAFAAEVRRSGGTLADDWLNNGPASVADQLPTGWQERLQLVFTGAGLELRCLGRQELHVRATLAGVARRLGHGL
jgi:hypothetical protein